MPISAPPPAETPEVTALLERERLEAAEAWEPDAPDMWVDHELDELLGGAWHDSAAGELERTREELLYAWERASEQLARWQGEQSRLLAVALDLATEGRGDAAMSVRSLAAELACAVGMSDRTVERQMNDAALLRDRFAATSMALREGRMSRSHAQAIVDEGIRLTDDDARAAYEEVVLERGAGLTTGRLRALAKDLAEHFDPVSLTERHRAAREGRRTTVCDGDDGMAELWMYGPAVTIHGMHDRVTQMARLVTAAETVDATTAQRRTLDQIRFDVLSDLVLTGHPTVEAASVDGGSGLDAIRAIVQISVPVLTLLGGDEPARLAGRVPIDPDTARCLAGAATIWDRILTDPITGDVLAVDRRFPTEAQRRHLRARDEHCRFPGCRMPTWRCDVDHTVDHQLGGGTAVCNLAHVCRRHHMLKHNSAWTLEQVDGELTWTSPLGRTYTDRPPPSVRFLPSAPPSEDTTDRPPW